METEKKDYSKTVNLPKTDFQMKANLAQREPGFLKDWDNPYLTLDPMQIINKYGANSPKI